MPGSMPLTGFITLYVLSLHELHQKPARYKICFYSVHLKHAMSGSISQRRFFLYYSYARTSPDPKTTYQYSSKAHSCFISILPVIHFSSQTCCCPSILLSACSLAMQSWTEVLRFHKDTYKMSQASVTLGIRCI